MFTPKTQRIKALAQMNPKVIKELEDIFSGETRMYIDYANVRPWSAKLKWNIELKRLKQFFDSFDNVVSISLYNGYIEGDKESEELMHDTEKWGYAVRTKPVKIMKFSIDASSILPDSTALLDHFIRRSLLRKYQISTIEYLNDRFRELNIRGELEIEDRKCNFDVEIGTDMLMDMERNGTETFVLWSGDSDFSDPIARLLQAGKKVILFATAGKVSRELSALREQGLLIFDIQKIRDFICWKKDMTLDI